MRLSAAALASVAMAAPGLAVASPAPSVLITRAQREMVRLDFERAIQLLRDAEATGKNRREQIILIYRSLGESQASLGRSEAAASEFRRLLSIDPEAELPPGSSPKLTAPFAAARDSMRRRPLIVTCERRGDGALFSVPSDPVDLVASVRLTRADGDDLPGAARTAGRDPAALAIPDGAPRALACAALDRHGNELILAPLLSASERAAAAGDDSADGDPTAILPPGEAAARRAAERERELTDPPRGTRSSAAFERDAARSDAPPLHARWWLWGTGALAAAGTATYFAIQLQADQDEWRDIKRASDQHSYREALDVQETGERHARYSNIAFGASAALAAVSIALLVRDVVRNRRTDSPATAGIRAGPLPDRGAAALLWLSF
jgi:hypothetical protein